MATELEHPADALPDHREIGFTVDEEKELSFLLLKVDNSRKALESSVESGRDYATAFTMKLIAEQEYRLRWTQVKLAHVTRESRDAVEEVATLHQRLNGLEYHFSKQLKETVATAMIDYQRQDDFNRMLAVYKNGLKVGARHEREKLQK